MLTEVADGVLVHRSELLRNNTVVVLGASGVLLVDPGLTRDEFACLATDLAGLGRPVVAGFATHPDWDHVLWDAVLGAAPRFGTERCAAVMREFLADPDWPARAEEALPPEIAGQVPLDLFGRITPLPEGADRIPWDGPVVRVVEHPAHAPGHAALLIEERGVLVAGDMLSDVFVPMLDDDRGEGDPVADHLGPATPASGCPVADLEGAAGGRQQSQQRRSGAVREGPAIVGQRSDQGVAPAQQTAAPIAAAFDLPLVTEPDLIEAENAFGTGPFQGYDNAETTLSLTQDLELWGRRGARVEVARAEAGTAALRRDQAVVDAQEEAQHSVRRDAAPNRVGCCGGLQRLSSYIEEPLP